MFVFQSFEFPLKICTVLESNIRKRDSLCVAMLRAVNIFIWRDAWGLFHKEWEPFIGQFSHYALGGGTSSRFKKICVGRD